MSRMRRGGCQSNGARRNEAWRIRPGARHSTSAPNPQPQLATNNRPGHKPGLFHFHMRVVALVAFNNLTVEPQLLPSQLHYIFTLDCELVPLGLLHFVRLFSSHLEPPRVESAHGSSGQAHYKQCGLLEAYPCPTARLSYSQKISNFLSNSSRPDRS